MDFAQRLLQGPQVLAATPGSARAQCWVERLIEIAPLLGGDAGTVQLGGGRAFGPAACFSTRFLRARARAWAKVRNEAGGASSMNGAEASFSASSMEAMPGDTSSACSTFHARLRAARARAAVLSSQFSARISAGSRAAPRRGANPATGHPIPARDRSRWPGHAGAASRLP